MIATRLSRPALLARIALLAFAYFLAAGSASSLAFVNASASAIWPPTGIAVAALLLFGRGVVARRRHRRVPRQPHHHRRRAVSAAIAAGNTLEAVIARGAGRALRARRPRLRAGPRRVPVRRCRRRHGADRQRDDRRRRRSRPRAWPSRRRPRGVGDMVAGRRARRGALRARADPAVDRSPAAHAPARSSKACIVGAALVAGRRRRCSAGGDAGRAQLSPRLPVHPAGAVAGVPPRPARDGAGGGGAVDRRGLGHARAGRARTAARRPTAACCWRRPSPASSRSHRFDGRAGRRAPAALRAARAPRLGADRSARS